MVDVALQQMEAMLRALMSTDNAVRNQAEEALAQARQAPDSLFSALIAMLRSNQDEQVRFVPRCASLCAGRQAPTTRARAW